MVHLSLVFSNKGYLSTTKHSSSNPRLYLNASYSMTICTAVILPFLSNPNHSLSLKMLSFPMLTWMNTHNYLHFVKFVSIFVKYYYFVKLPQYSWQITFLKSPKLANSDIYFEQCFPDKWRKYIHPPSRAHRHPYKRTRMSAFWFSVTFSFLFGTPHVIHMFTRIHYHEQEVISAIF